MPPKSKREAKRGQARRRAGVRRSAAPRASGLNNKNEADYKMRTMGTGITGGFASVWMNHLQQPDTIIVKLRYETTSAFTSTAGAASYVQVKGNSIYRPYVGNTDSCGGYARMYSDYEYAGVLSAKLTVRLWGGVSGQDEPFRLVAIPCSLTQYNTYSAFSNVAQLYDVPHSRQAIFSPGGALPSLVSKGTTASVLLGQSRETGIELATSTTYLAGSGVDPASLWYFLIGYQNFAGTTTTNQQAQVSVEYVVRFSRPIPTPVQVDMNRFGNCSSTESKRVAPASAFAEMKASVTPPDKGAKDVSFRLAEFKKPLATADGTVKVDSLVVAAAAEVAFDADDDEYAEFLLWKSRGATKAGIAASLAPGAKPGSLTHGLKLDPG